MEYIIHVSWALLCCIAALLGQHDGEAATSHPPGHLQPIGSDRAPEGPIDAVEGFSNVEPEPFFKKYIEGSRPLLFKGAADIVPAYHKWTDQYLREKYGTLTIGAEIGKKETRKDGKKSMSMSQFLDSYKESDIYMVQDALALMKGDIVVPKPIICGGYAEAMQTALIWFSSGGTKSVLHSDGLDNINCLFDGSKHLYFVNPKYGDRVEKEHWVENGGCSSVDVEKVDMYKFPSLRDLPWFSVTMEKGDCLFIPMGWYHTVNSSPSRNIAVNLWFQHIDTFNKTECDAMGPNIPQFDSLAEERYKYSMANRQPFGYSLSADKMSDNQLRQFLFGGFPETPISLEKFRQVLEAEASKSEIEKAFADFDLDKDGSISKEDNQKAPIRDIIKDHPWLFPSDDSKPGQSEDTKTPDSSQDGREEL